MRDSKARQSAGAARKPKGRRRGMAVLWVGVTLTTLAAFVSLAVDFGRVQLVKMELQTAADASARAAVNSLPSVSGAQSAAATVAAANYADGSSVELQTNQDVEFGRWDDDTDTFTALAGTARATANAVRVTCRRTQSRQNAVKLFFASLIGKDRCDVQASATAAMIGLSFGVVGLDYIKMGGNSSNSYWSDGTATSGNWGNIGSNGDITLGGSSSIQGNARPGPGHTVYGANKVTGTTDPLTSALSFPPVSAGYYAYSNDNWRLASNMMSASSFSLGKNKTGTMPAGHYYFNNFTMGSGSVLNLEGPTVIFVYGDVNLGGHASTAGNLPKNLIIVTVNGPNGAAPGSISIGGSSALYAAIYAPQSPITMSGTGDLYGSIVAKSIDMTGTSAIHYDLAITGKIGISLVK